MRKPALYRGADGVMRTLAQSAAHLGVSTEELRMRWFGDGVAANHIRDDRKYYDQVRRNVSGRER